MRLLLALSLFTGCAALRDGARIRSSGPETPALARQEAVAAPLNGQANAPAVTSETVTAPATTVPMASLDARSPVPSGGALIAPRATSGYLVPTSPEESAQENLMPKKEWNRLAVPAFIAAAGTVYLGLTTTSAFVVIAAILVTLTLAGIALKRIRTHRQSGKGFAFAALMIGVFAALLTAISIGFYGVE